MSNSVLAKSIVIGSPYVSGRFESADPTGFRLNLLISNHQLQLLVADEKDMIVYLQPLETAGKSISFFDHHILSDAFSELDILRKEFNWIHAGFFTRLFSVLPDTHDSESASQWLGGGQSLEPRSGTELCRNRLTGLNASVTFLLPRAICDFLDTTFPSYSKTHIAAAHLNNLLQESDGLQTHAVLTDSAVLFFCLDGRNLLFANSFNVNSAEDFIYYVMAVYHSLKLNPEEIPLTLSGEIVKESAIFQAASKYVRNAKFGAATALWKLEDDYPFPNHFYSSLLSL